MATRYPLLHSDAVFRHRNPMLRTARPPADLWIRKPPPAWQQRRSSSMHALGADDPDPSEPGMQPGPRAQASGSFRKVTKKDAENLSQIFGPSRTPLPASTPPSRQAAAVAAMNAIEAATSWRQLLDTFSLVTKLPSNHSHLLAMTQALVALSAALDHDTLLAEVEELQRFAGELLRATRLPLNSAYSPSEVAALLRCFCTIGVPPDEAWLYASEAALVAGAHRNQAAARAQGSEAALDLESAVALLAAAGCYKICDHEPRPQLVQLLPACASLVWSAGGGGGAAVSPDAVVLPSGQQLDLAPGSQEAGGDVRPVPAQWLLAVVHAATAWGMPTGDAWLQALVDCSYFGLCETEEQYGAEAGEKPAAAGDGDGDGTRVWFEAGQLSDLLWGLIVLGVNPGRQWLEAYLDASAALLHRRGGRAAAGPTAEQCCSMLAAVTTLAQSTDAGVVRPAWVEALLRCVVDDIALAPPDALSRLLFDVGAQDEQLTPGARACVVALGLHAQILMGQEQEVAGHADPDAAAFTPQGLTFLLMGLVRCQALPQELPGSWLPTWADRARALRHDFTAQQAAAVLSAAAKAELPLPAAAALELAGAQLLGSASPPAEDLGAEQLEELLEALLPQPCLLPAPWLPRIRLLAEPKLKDLRLQRLQRREQPDPQLEPSMCLTLLQLSIKAEELEEQEVLGPWLEALVQQLGEAGGLQEPVVLAEVARILGLIGPPAAHVMPQVEAACLPLGPDMTWDQYQLMLGTFAATGYCPGSQWWKDVDTSVAAATSPGSLQPPGAAAGSDAGVGAAMRSYCALRTAVGTDTLQKAGAGAVYGRLRSRSLLLLEQLCAAGGGMTASSIPVDGGSPGIQDDAKRSREQEGQLVGSLQLLLPALAAGEEALPLETCSALCSLTQNLQGLGGPEVWRACLDIFEASGFAATSSWQDRAAQDAYAVLQQGPGSDSGLGPGEICTLLAAQARSGQGSPADGAAPGLAQLLLEEAGRQAAAFSPPQVLRVLQHAAAMGAEDALGPSALEALLEAAATGGAAAPAVPLQAAEVAALLRAVCSLGVQPPAPWVQHFLELLLQPSPSHPQQLALETISDDPSAIEDLVLALDLWDVEMPEGMVGLLLQGLPALAERDAGVASCVLHFLSEQEQWDPEPGALRAAALRLAQALCAGAVPPTRHAMLLSALAEAAGGAGADAGTLCWMSREQLAQALEASGAALPAYTPDQQCAVLGAWVALGAAPLPDAWLERFFAYCSPARCATPLLPELLLAAASASGLGDGDAARRGAGVPPAWLGGVESAVRGSAAALSSRDAAVLMAGFAELGHRPSQALVNELLDHALLRAQQEEQRRQGGPGAGAGPEAAGVVGLIAAVYTSLGFSPSAEWTARAKQVLYPVLRRIQDPRTLQSINSALAAAG